MKIVLYLMIGTVTYIQASVWSPDTGKGSYRNPILHADYSDPDVVAVGDDFYMTASSFNCIPGLPILHSTDLVNWKLVNHALKKQEPLDFFNIPQHGKGVWAPCIRYHQGEFYIYWGDPDFGIYLTKTTDPMADWSEPVLVKAGKGLIDPTPLWDDDGKVYLAYAYAGSRSGINSVVVVAEMNSEGTRVLSGPVLVFDGNDGVNHTIEGPKFYKRNGYYYILAPAGGVEYGWQLALRSRSVYGPYEARKVMHQGETSINGPHQGGWVETVFGESWFVHFQHKDAYGRIIHLNPMTWVNDWPVIGVDADGDGCGEPVAEFRKPQVNRNSEPVAPSESDEFDSRTQGLEWQWHANYHEFFGFPTESGYMRILAHRLSSGCINYWEVPNLYLRKFPAEEFGATTRIRFTAKEEGDRGGIIVMGWDYSHLSLVKKGDRLVLEQAICMDAEQGNPERTIEVATLKFDEVYKVGSYNYLKDIYLRVEVAKGGSCRFSYSEDGVKYIAVGEKFKARQGKWIGAKVGLFAVQPAGKNMRGWIDADWFRITALQK